VCDKERVVKCRRQNEEGRTRRLNAIPRPWFVMVRGGFQCRIHEKQAIHKNCKIFEDGCDKMARSRDRMARIQFVLPKIKGNQGKSSPREGNLFKRGAMQKAGSTKVSIVPIISNFSFPRQRREWIRTGSSEFESEPPLLTSARQGMMGRRKACFQRRRFRLEC
jgi:hypothetical protein